MRIGNPEAVISHLCARSSPNPGDVYLFGIRSRVVNSKGGLFLMQLTGFAYYGWTGQQSGSGFPTTSFSICFAKTGSENTFLSELCVIRGHFGRYFGQNNEIVSVFNGSVVHFNVGIRLTFLGRSCSTCQELYFQLFVRNDFGRWMSLRSSAKRPI